MTATMLFVYTDGLGIKWYCVACPRCPDIAVSLRTYGPTLDACRAHDARHAGQDAAGAL